jgi:hypothetical protein
MSVTDEVGGQMRDAGCETSDVRRRATTDFADDADARDCRSQKAEVRVWKTVART